MVNEFSTLNPYTNNIAAKISNLQVHEKKKNSVRVLKLKIDRVNEAENQGHRSSTEMITSESAKFICKENQTTHNNVDIQTDIRGSMSNMCKDFKTLLSPRNHQERKLVRFRKVENYTDGNDTLELRPVEKIIQNINENFDDCEELNKIIYTQRKQNNCDGLTMGNHKDNLKSSISLDNKELIQYTLDNKNLCKIKTNLKKKNTVLLK